MLLFQKFCRTSILLLTVIFLFSNSYAQKFIHPGIDQTAADMEYIYYQGLALEKLGKTAESKQVFNKMLSDVQKKQESSAFFTQFERSQSRDLQVATNHYLPGLAYEGLGEKDKCRDEYMKALKLNPAHIWSKTHLESL